MSDQSLIVPDSRAVATTNGATTTYEGSVTFTIAGQQYTLTGTLGNDFIMSYHASFADSISLGTVAQMADQIGTAIGVPGLGDEIKNVQAGLQTIPVLGPLVNLILNASIRITDLEINTQAKRYQVGLALDFTTEPVAQRQLFGITLESLGFKATYQTTGNGS
jgi:hypothetical protein